MFRIALGGFTAFSAVTAGAIYYDRNKLINETISEAEKQRSEAASKCFALEKQILELEKEEQEHVKELEDKMDTVESLWNERDRRIASETKRAADCIFVTPESFAVINGLQAHCNDSAGKFPMFYEEFDLNASKLHTIGMLLNSVRRSMSPFSSSCVSSESVTSTFPSTSTSASSKNRKTLQDISPALGMFRSDPVVSAINLQLHAEKKLQNCTKKSKNSKIFLSNINNNSDDSSSSLPLPNSVDELSILFSRYLRNFQETLKNAIREQRQIKKRIAARQKKGEPGSAEETMSTTTSNNNNNDLHDDEVDDEEYERSLGFFAHRILPRFANAAHMMTTAEADMKMLKDRQEEKSQQDTIVSWNLYNSDDVLSAVRYVTSTHKKLVDFAEQGEIWAVHPTVVPAMKNLCVWSLAAEQYLAEEQTTNVLSNVVKCTSHSFVQINPLPDSMEKGSEEEH